MLSDQTDSNPRDGAEAGIGVIRSRERGIEGGGGWYESRAGCYSQAEGEREHTIRHERIVAKRGCIIGTQLEDRIGSSRPLRRVIAPRKNHSSPPPNSRSLIDRSIHRSIVPWDSFSASSHSLRPSFSWSFSPTLTSRLC